jgi:ribonucleotide monophosphatase NagD (HAD superfamily)
LFLACNEDSRGNFSSGNQEWPGAGASVAAISAVVGRGPDAVAGKPSIFMAREVVARLAEEARGSGSSSSSSPPRVLMVGDRLDTDVAWAHAAADALWAEEEAAGGVVQERNRRRRFGALLVMSGVVKDADLEAWEGRPPEFVLEDVGQLATALEAAAASTALAADG